MLLQYDWKSWREKSSEFRRPPTAAVKCQIIRSRPWSWDGIEYGRNATPRKIVAPSHDVENLPSAAAMQPCLRGYKYASMKRLALFSIIVSSMSRLPANVWKDPLLLMPSSLRVIEFLGLRQARVHHHCLMYASRAMRSLIDQAVVLSHDSSACRSRSRR